MGRAKRNAVDVDVEDRQGVCDGIGHGRHSTDDSSLTYTLEPADRVYGWGFDVVDTAIGDVQRRGQLVFEEIGVENLPLLVIDDLFHQHLADALRDTALDLSVHNHGINHAATIVDYGVLLYRHRSELWINGHLCDMYRIGHGCERRVIVVG